MGAQVLFRPPDVGPPTKPAAVHGEGSLVIFKGTTLVFLQALSVEPEVRLPHSDLVLVGKNRFVTNTFGPKDIRLVVYRILCLAAPS